MKELTTEELKQIAYNCGKATFLIEKKQIGSITSREEMELKFHLAGCPVCRLFEEQSITINRLVKDLSNDPHHKEPALDENFKKVLQERIKQKLHKK